MLDITAFKFQKHESDDPRPRTSTKTNRIGRAKQENDVTDQYLRVRHQHSQIQVKTWQFARFQYKRAKLQNV